MIELLTSRKYKVPQNEGEERSPYQRDVHRIIYSDAFRRLKHKTQVFFVPLNDHICTRMDHVLCVAEASTSVARRLGLDEDLTRAISYGHDIGHAPFGHHGEIVLSEILKDKGFAYKFSHEIQGLRVVDSIATLDRYDGPSGLNLTYAVRDGIVSHCGEDSSTRINPMDPTKKDLDHILATNTKSKDQDIPVTKEGCIVRICDKIAYVGRDIEDALVAGLISEDRIKIELSNEIGLLGSINGKIVGSLLRNLIQNSQNSFIGLSEEHGQALNNIMKWNYQNIYNHETVKRYKEQVSRGIKMLFDQLMEDLDYTNRLNNKTNTLPKPGTTNVYKVLKVFMKEVNYSPADRNEIILIDFIAGMTDNYLIRCIKDLFLPESIV